ncbi:hypothetical protein OEZ85_005779 [Tetradesmus obliquus]|uniref:Proteophosphoglycan ppg4 n=1 Tax=Tetradesmus obliquus TaxID=3088 RepID=A0ABY8UFQ2_TETOB|nr:hypothetical protein OEZ85_005779 [Tetradesmus obliquus]
MGRPSGVSSTPPTASTAAAAAAPATTPLAGPSGTPLTPSSFQTPPTAPEQQHQELPAQKGHPAATPVFNISPATAAEQAGPIPSVSTTTGASKWKSSAASSSTGPVFSVVSRGNRVGASHTPPAPPAKANSTIARTANRLQGRSTSSTSPSGSSIGLRGQRTTPSTLSSSSSGPAGRAFGSRIGTGRFGDSSSTASSSRSCTTPFITNTSCKSVARTLSFDAAADSPKSTTPGISNSKIPGAASKPKEGLAGKPTAGAAQGLAAAASMDDVDPTLDQLDQLTHGNSSSGDSTTWLSGANNSADGAAAASCSSLPFAGLEQPPAADPLGMHDADLASVDALLSSTLEGTAVFPASTGGDLTTGRAAGRKSSALGNLVLLLWSSLLLVVGFVAAAVLSVLEGEAMLGGGGGSGTVAGGFCGVGPGGAYGVAAELCGGLGVGVGWQQQAGAEMQDWGAAAMQRGRRFGA